jgi:hypothetical protein
VGGVDAGVEDGDAHALPVRPWFQAAGAPIWVRFGSSAVPWTRRSSQTRVTPASGLVAGGERLAWAAWVAARAAPRRAATALGWRTAVARRLASVRTGRSAVLASTGGRLVVLACCTISGRLDALASP